MAKAWTKDIVLDLGTFGGTKVCHVLAEMMNQGVIPVYEKHRVLSFINATIHDFKEISVIQDKGVKYRVMYLMRDKRFETIDRMQYPKKFCSFLKNIINYYCRRALNDK